MAADVDVSLPLWSTTRSSNKPAGTATVGTGWDDNLREIQGVIRGWLASKGADIASAATTDLGAVEGFAHDITGAVTITSFGTVATGIHKVVKFEGAALLVHSSSLILPGAESILAADGDIGWFISEGSGNWRCIVFTKAAVSPNAGFRTGDVKQTVNTTAEAGWVAMDDGTMGNAASGGTTRANADTAALFTILWNGTADADCAVSGGRGANAAADYAANKTIALPKALGRALAASGAGAGLTSRALAKALGDENSQAHTHTGTTGGQTANHTHSDYYQITNVAASLDFAVSPGSGNTGITAISESAGGTNTGATSADHAHTFTSASTGTGTAQNMQPTLFLLVKIKL